MWKLILHCVLAAVGLLMLRKAVYFRTWGHGAPQARFVLPVIGGLLVWPLAQRGTPAVYWLGGAALLLFIPYRQLLLQRARAMGRSGAERLAAEHSVPFQSSDGDEFFTVSSAEGSDPEWWAGNVLTRVRSLHPGVSTQQTYRMMAFVVRLKQHPPLCCSFMRGRQSPKYFAREWREQTQMQGQMFGLSMGDMLSDEDSRDTGADREPVQGYTQADIGEIKGFQSAGGTHPERLSEVFTPDLLASMHAASSQTLQYEFNITPTSVNVYTTYCGFKVQKAILDFLLELEKKLSSMEPGEEPPAIEESEEGNNAPPSEKDTTGEDSEEYAGGSETDGDAAQDDDAEEPA
jgi:hypothetical protein